MYPFTTFSTDVQGIRFTGSVTDEHFFRGFFPMAAGSEGCTIPVLTEHAVFPPLVGRILVTMLV